MRELREQLMIGAVRLERHDIYFILHVGMSGMPRSYSQRSTGAPSIMQLQLQEEPTISAWDTDQDGWEKDSHGRRDEIKLYMADRSMQVGPDSGVNLTGSPH